MNTNTDELAIETPAQVGAALRGLARYFERQKERFEISIAPVATSAEALAKAAPNRESEPDAGNWDYDFTELPGIRAGVMDLPPRQGGFYRRNEWRPTWTVNFGAHRDMTLEAILAKFGPAALLPYRQRAINELAKPREAAHATTNATMLAQIDALLASANYPLIKMLPSNLGKELPQWIEKNLAAPEKSR